MNKYQEALKTFGNVPFIIGHFRVFEKSNEYDEWDITACGKRIIEIEVVE